ncbi:MAG: hypothetical protein EOO43_19540 [Flavobacterium sp.]|nr:MAG: hypothetical protein EOO43_19540 [Flavobacterium sp.]
MKTKTGVIQLFFLSILAICSSCSMEAGNAKQLNPADSFMPMQIGNTWTLGAQNYTKILDTVRIGNGLYYKFYSLVGGDATDVKYLRIDKDDNLLESYPDQPGKLYVHAKFGAEVNDEFFTIGDGSVNDYKVRVTEKTADRMTFEFDMVNHPKLKGNTHKVSYIKGLGIDEKWKSITIDGKTVRSE